MVSAIISYMGTKHELAQPVREVIDQARAGMLLDAFAGMGAVAQAIGTSRPIWTNDVQHFAHMASSAVFTSSLPPPSAADFADQVEPHFENHRMRLSTRLAASLSHERNALLTSSFREMLDSLELASAAYSKIRKSKNTSSCFTNTYAGTYFSLHQCIEIDSARHAADYCLRRGEITPETWRWAIVGLGRAALKVANTPGHFAQYLRNHERTFRRTQRQRKRSVWAEWLIALSEMRPCGTPEWRGGNKSTCSDSLALLKNDPSIPDVAVVYCDPPYTDDQYSRFYHVLETLVLFDYPKVTGMGQYREDRFTTPFSLKAQVGKAFESLIGSVAASGADLVLSYPSDGLLHRSGFCVQTMLRASFPSVEVATQIAHCHSTFGASKGASKAHVIENIYLARQ